MISNLLMISPIDIGSSFWSGRTRITLICRTLLIECFGINFILLIPWRAPHLRVTFHHNSGDAAPSLATGGCALTAASPIQDVVGALLGRTPQRFSNAVGQWKFLTSIQAIIQFPFALHCSRRLKDPCYVPAQRGQLRFRRGCRALGRWVPTTPDHRNNRK